MFSEFVTKREFLLTSVFSLIVLTFVFATSFFTSDTKIVICDVGQGDAAYIRTSEKVDILVDAGPHRSVLSCLGRHMPFYDRRIELAIITHPQHDHYGGFIDVVDRYEIDTLIAPPVDNDNKSFANLKQKISDAGTIVRNVYSGETVRTGSDVALHFLWPTSEFVTANAFDVSVGGSDPTHTDVLGALSTSTDLNAFSEIFVLSQGDFDLLMTGDATSQALSSILSRGLLDEGTKIEVLKVPHHGSHNGLTEEFLKYINPSISVISVGAKNSYGHPSRAVLDMFDGSGRSYVTTAEEGDVVIDVGDTGWNIR